MLWNEKKAKYADDLVTARAMMCWMYVAYEYDDDNAGYTSVHGYTPYSV